MSGLNFDNSVGTTLLREQTKQSGPMLQIGNATKSGESIFVTADGSRAKTNHARN